MKRKPNGRKGGYMKKVTKAELMERIEALRIRVQREWEDLQEFVEMYGVNGVRTDCQRARWVAYDTALEILTKGEF